MRTLRPCLRSAGTVLSLLLSMNILADDVDTTYPIVIEHAFGTTTIDRKPERVATVAWANHEVPLALGVVPVGFAAAGFGDDDDDGVLPWVSARLEQLNADVPTLFDEGDGIDFEAVAAVSPDVILAAYSGLDQEDYETLSMIAPVVAYPDAPWMTDWRDVIRYNSRGMGLGQKGDELIVQLEADIAATREKYPSIEGKSAMFITHLDPRDLSIIRFYSANDKRVQFFEDLGMHSPASVVQATQPGRYNGEVSAEQVDLFDDVDIFVSYGNEQLLETLRSDPLASRMRAIASDSIVLLGSGPVATAASPTPLSISWVLEDYVKQLAEAARKIDE